MSKKIFITGGTGFVGSYVLRALLRKDYEVVALRRSSASLPKIPLEMEPRWMEGDLSSDFSHALASCDVLIHLAAKGLPPRKSSWEECFETNVHQSLRLYESAITNGVRRIIVSGSYAEYGLSGLRYECIPPDAPLEPTDAYAASKAAGCIAATALARKEKIELVYFRLFSVFGEGQFENNFWPALKKAAESGQDFEMTPGEQVRDFVTVEETAEWFIKAIEAENVVSGDPKILNLASGNPVTLRGFAEFWWAHWKATGSLKLGAIPYRSHEVMRYVPLVLPKI